MRLDWLTSGPLSVNTYIVGADDTKDCAVIDPGGAAPVLSYLAQKGLTCKAILITHGHFDHIGGVAELHEKTGAPVYIHQADAEALSSDRRSLSMMMGTPLTKAKADVLLGDGDAFDVAGLHVRVLHTPGHTPGGVCYVLDAERVIFCGDTVFFESYGRTDFPNASQEDLYHAIVDRLFSLEGDYKLYCGHEESTTLAHERLHNPILIDRY